MSEVLVLVDHADGAVKKPTYELLTIAKRLGEPSAVFIGSGDKGAEVADKVKAYGAEKVYVVDDAEIKGYLVAPKAEVLQQLVEKTSAAAVLIPSTMEGKEIGGRLAIKLESGLITDAVDVHHDRLSPRCHRLRLGETERVIEVDLVVAGLDPCPGGQQRVGDPPVGCGSEHPDQHRDPGIPGDLPHGIGPPPVDRLGDRPERNTEPAHRGFGEHRKPSPGIGRAPGVVADESQVRGRVGACQNLRQSDPHGVQGIEVSPAAAPPQPTAPSAPHRVGCVVAPRSETRTPVSPPASPATVPAARTPTARRPQPTSGRPHRAGCESVVPEHCGG